MLIRLIVVLMFCIGMSTNMTRPIAVLFASDLGASTFQIGTLAAAYALLPIAFAIHVGRVADIFGDRLPVIFGLVGVSVGMAFPWIFPQMWALYASQVLVGTTQLFVVISLQNLVGNRATAEQREAHFGMFASAVSVAGVVGPVTGSWLADHFSYGTAYLGAVIATVVALGLAFFMPADRPAARERREVGLSASLGLLKLPLIRRALFSSALVLYSRDVFVTYFPLYAKDIGLSILVIGWIISLQGLAMVVVRALLPRLTGRFGRDRVLIGSVVMAGLAFLALPLTQSVILLFILGAVMGAGLGFGQPLSMVETYEASPKARTGEVLGLRMTANRVSQFIAPLFFGMVGSSLGVLSVFLISGFFLLGGTYALRLKSK